MTKAEVNVWLATRIKVCPFTQVASKSFVQTPALWYICVSEAVPSSQCYSQYLGTNIVWFSAILFYTCRDHISMPLSRIYLLDKKIQVKIKYGFHDRNANVVISRLSSRVWKGQHKQNKKKSVAKDYMRDDSLENPDRLRSQKRVLI